MSPDHVLSTYDSRPGRPCSYDSAHDAGYCPQPSRSAQAYGRTGTHTGLGYALARVNRLANRMESVLLDACTKFINEPNDADEFLCEAAAAITDDVREEIAAAAHK